MLTEEYIGHLVALLPKEYQLKSDIMSEILRDLNSDDSVKVYQGIKDIESFFHYFENEERTELVQKCIDVIVSHNFSSIDIPFFVQYSEINRDDVGFDIAYKLLNNSNFIDKCISSSSYHRILDVLEIVPSKCRDSERFIDMAVDITNKLCKDLGDKRKNNRKFEEYFLGSSAHNGLFEVFMQAKGGNVECENPSFAPKFRKMNDAQAADDYRNRVSSKVPERIIGLFDTQKEIIGDLKDIIKRTRGIQI